MDLTKYLISSHSLEITAFIKEDTGKAAELILKTVVDRGYSGDSFSIVAPIYHGKIVNFNIDETVDVTFGSPSPSHKEFYRMRCKVIGRKFENNLSTLSLTPITNPSKVQRRQAFRVNIYNTYTFSYRESQYELVTKDISCTGMLALSTVQLNKNAVFDIVFDANPKPKDAYDSDYTDDKVFRIRCKVLDSIPQTEIRRYLNRIQFEGLKDHESKFLMQYLYAKQTEILHMDPNTSQKIAAYFENTRDDYIDIHSSEYKRLQIISLVSIIPMFISLVMLLLSRPKQMYVLDYFFNFYRPQNWQQNYLLGAMIASLLVVVIDLVGLYYNLMEIKKNNRTIHWSLLFTLIISLAIIIFVLTVSSINSIPLI